MREYNRASDNSFEVILWTNDSFEFRYGALDVINHDVLIGEVGSGSSEVYQYLYHDECNTGSTNSSSCVNTNWNDSSSNALLENGGSLFGKIIWDDSPAPIWAPARFLGHQQVL